MVKDKDSILCFCMWVTIPPPQDCWRDNSFPHCIFLAPTLEISWLYMSTKLISGFLFCPLIDMSIFMPLKYYFKYCSFVMYFEVRKCDALSFVLFSQDMFGFVTLLLFYMNFMCWVFFSNFCQKCCWDFN